MSRLIIAVVILAAAVAIAALLRAKLPQPPTQARWAVPAQLDRADFDRPDAPWLVVVFSSTTCARLRRCRRQGGGAGQR